MRTLRVITTSGNEANLPVNEILTIDGVPFAAMTPVDLQSLNRRLTILEDAHMGLTEQVAMLHGRLTEALEPPSTEG